MRNIDKDYEQCGIKMTDLQKIKNSLQCSWVLEISDENPLKTFIQNTLTNTMENYYLNATCMKTTFITVII